MAKWLNCCGEGDHLLFCNHYATLLTYSLTHLLTTQFPICRKPFFCPSLMGKNLRPYTLRHRPSKWLREKNLVAERSRSAGFFGLDQFDLTLRLRSGTALRLRSGKKIRSLSEAEVPDFFEWMSLF